MKMVAIKTCLAFYLVTLSVSLVRSQFTGCDYLQNLIPGVSYNIFSPSYPNLYNAGVNCRWTATSSSGTTINLNCATVELPISTGCTNDRLEVSRTGLNNLADAHRYCGRGTFVENSISNRLVIGLRTFSNSIRGRFICTITVNSCLCGRRNRNLRIVGGQEARVNEFPMMAGIVDSRIRRIVCGATIISNHYAVSAAHCVTPQQLPLIYFGLVVGEHDTSVGIDTSFTVLHTVSRVTIHSQFNSARHINDIAIVQTTNQIVFNQAVGPACLPFNQRNQLFANSRVETAGWGTLWFGGPTSSRLMKVSLDVITNQACARNVVNLPSTNMCTLTAGRDTCQYDSGGPLLWTNSINGLLYHVGIVSHGVACATNSPGVSTRVTSYLSWIEQNTPGVNYCRI